MANLKNITELPLAESAEGLNLIVNDNGAAKQIAASSVNVQANWNQNDETAPDYIKNKPFFSSGIKEEYICCLPEITLKDSDGESGFGDENSTDYDISNLNLKFNNMYGSDITNNTIFIININGIEYKTTITYWEEGHSYFGLHSTELTDKIPFNIHFLLDEYESVYVGFILSMTLHPSINLPVNTISVYRDEKVEVEYIQKIDSKYLPVEEWDLDIDISCFYEEDADGNGGMNTDYTINNLNDFENIKNKILSDIQPKCKVKVTSTGWDNADSSIFYTESFNNMFCTYYPAIPESSPEFILFSNHGSATYPYIILSSDNTIVEIGDDW